MFLGMFLVLPSEVMLRGIVVQFVSFFYSIPTSFGLNGSYLNSNYILTYGLYDSQVPCQH